MTLTPSDFVEHAVTFVDSHGLDALTMRALGEEMGVDATALYRHFPSKQSLLGAMVDWFLGQAVDALDQSLTDPRARIVNMARVVRETFKSHPEVGAALANSSGGGEIGSIFSRIGIEAIRALGLSGHDLVVGYQAFESFVVGSSVFDFAGAPHNVTIRRARYRQLDVPEFDTASATESSVGDVTSDGFELAVTALVDRLEAMAATTRNGSPRA